MSKVEELERAIEQLPPEDLEKLSRWMAQRRAAFAQTEDTRAPLAFRDHSAFLSSYSPDEGLYSDTHGR